MNEEIKDKLNSMLANRELVLKELYNLQSLDTEVAASTVYRLYAIEDEIINNIIDISDDDYYESIKFFADKLFRERPNVTIDDLVSVRILAIKLHDEAHW